MKKILPILIGAALAVAGIVWMFRRKVASTSDPITPDTPSAPAQPIPSMPSIPESESDATIESDASINDGEKDKKRTANLKKLILTLITILQTVLAIIKAKERSA